MIYSDHVQDKQAQRNKKQHEENGWIESKKGQHDSKVWLKIQPKDGTSTTINKVRVDKDFRERYTEIIDKHDMNESVVYPIHQHLCCCLKYYRPLLYNFHNQSFVRHYTPAI